MINHINKIINLLDQKKDQLFLFTNLISINHKYPKIDLFSSCSIKSVHSFDMSFEKIMLSLLFYMKKKIVIENYYCHTEVKHSTLEIQLIWMLNVTELLLCNYIIHRASINFVWNIEMRDEMFKIDGVCEWNNFCEYVRTRAPNTSTIRRIFVKKTTKNSKW